MGGQKGAGGGDEGRGLQGATARVFLSMKMRTYRMTEALVGDQVELKEMKQKEGEKKKGYQ